MSLAELPKFRLSKYRFKLVAETRLELPSFAGSTLRGGFGGSFRRLTCSMHRGKCTSCLLRATCPYNLIFEAPQTKGSPQLKRFQTPPKPFILEPPLESKRIYDEGQSFTFGLVLIGLAMDYLPYFILAFRDLGWEGMGKGRGKFHLEGIDGLDPFSDQAREVYSSSDEMVRSVDLSVSLDDFFQRYGTDEVAEEVRVQFLTPTRIKRMGSYGGSITFESLMHSLLNRVTNLAYNYCDQKEPVDFRELVKLARGVTILREEKRWWEWRRFSSRQETRMYLGGYVGQVIYKGELKPFWPWLKLGELIHVGKNCGFGLGRIRVIEQKD